jgi:hypothetical protein
MGMAAGSGRRKMKGGKGVLPIVTGNLVICDYRFRTKKGVWELRYLLRIPG